MSSTTQFSLQDPRLEEIFQEQWGLEEVKDIEIAPNQRLKFIRLKSNSNTIDTYLNPVLNDKKLVISYDSVGNNLIFVSSEICAIIDMKDPLAPSVKASLCSLTRTKIIILDISEQTQQILSRNSIQLSAYIVTKCSQQYNTFLSKMKSQCTDQVYDYFEQYNKYIVNNAKRGNPFPSKVIAYLTVCLYPALFCLFLEGNSAFQQGQLKETPPPGIPQPMMPNPMQPMPNFNPRMQNPNMYPNYAPNFNPQPQVYHQFNPMPQFQPMPAQMPQFCPMPAPPNQFIQGPHNLAPITPQGFALPPPINRMQSSPMGPLSPQMFAQAPSNGPVQSPQPAFHINPALLAANLAQQNQPNQQKPQQQQQPEQPRQEHPKVASPPPQAQSVQAKSPPASPQQSIDMSKIAIKKEATGGVTDEFWAQLEKLEIGFKARGELDLDGLKFKCALCKQKCTSPVYLLQHMWEHHKE